MTSTLRVRFRTSVRLVAIAAALAGCASDGQKSESLGQVDSLLSSVERVQSESLLCKERSTQAYEALRTITSTDFQGDALTAHHDLTQKVEQSRNQARTLAATVAPMKQAADEVMLRWTTDLEAIGSSRLRQTSQMRLEETRRRYETVLSSVVAAQIAYDAYNADLNDHALFLAHDFNAAAVTAIQAEVETLGEQQRLLDQRLDACIAASKEYIESSALRGQLTVSTVEVKPATPAATTTTTPTPATPRRRVRTLPPPTGTEATPTTTPSTTPPSDSNGGSTNGGPTNGGSGTGTPH